MCFVHVFKLTDYEISDFILVKQSASSHFEKGSFRNVCFMYEFPFYFCFKKREWEREGGREGTFLGGKLTHTFFYFILIKVKFLC